MTSFEGGLRKDEWFIADTPLAEARDLVCEHHYARGGANTGVYVHGLYRRSAPSDLKGIAWWMPPTRVAAESVDRDRWTRVLCLTRLAIHPDVPKNAATFLLAGSRKMVDPFKWVALVTYADERQGHLGGIYRADNWTYVGRTGPYPAWADPTTGQQVARKATRSRTVAEMKALGYVRLGSFYKHKYVRHPRRAQAGANRAVAVAA